MSWREKLTSLSPAQMGMIIFAIAFAVRLAAIFGMGMDKQPLNFVEVEKIGVSLAETGVFGNPFRIPTGPSATSAPFYPFLSALVFKLVGYGLTARLVLLLASAVAVSLQYTLLPWLAVRCGIPAYVGAVAGLMGAALPVRLITELNGYEAPFGGAVWILALIVTLGWMASPSTGRSLGCGAMWGTALMVHPPLILPLFLLLAGLSWRHWRGQPGPGWKQIVMAGLMVSLFLTPWTVRNYLTFGHIFYLRNNLGLELSTSQFPGITLVDDESHPSMQLVYQRHPYTSEAIAREVLEKGEIAFNKERMQQGLGYIKADPQAFLWRTVQRIWLFWFIPSKFPAYKNFYIFPFTAAGLWGVWLIWRRRPGPGLCFVSGVIGFPIVYYLMKIMSRYRYPIEWMMLFLCCYTLWAYLAADGDRGKTANG